LVRFPDPEGARPRGWVDVATAPNAMIASVLEGVLKSAGIPVMVQKPSIFVYTGAGGTHSVLVPVENEEEARQALEDARAEAESDDEQEGES